MRRVEQDVDWSFFCPNAAPGLADCWGAEFEELYERYEKEGRAKMSVKARKIWTAILESQTETGVPYMLYKDACNRKSNQKVRQPQPWRASHCAGVSSVCVSLSEPGHHQV